MRHLYSSKTTKLMAQVYVVWHYRKKYPTSSAFHVTNILNTAHCSVWHDQIYSRLCRKSLSIISKSVWQWNIMATVNVWLTDWLDEAARHTFGKIDLVSPRQPTTVRSGDASTFISRNEHVNSLYAWTAASVIIIIIIVILTTVTISKWTRKHRLFQDYSKRTQTIHACG